MDERAQEHRGKPNRQAKVSVLVGIGVFLVAMGAALFHLSPGARSCLAFVLVHPECLAGLLVFAIAAICLGTVLSRRQWTMAIVAGIAMALGASCAAVTWFYGGRVRDLTPVMHERLGGDKAEPKGPAQDRDTGVVREK